MPSQLKAVPQDDHLDRVMETVYERDQDAIWSMVMKFAAWKLDSNAPGITAQELLEELSELIEHRSACIQESDKESRKWSGA